MGLVAFCLAAMVVILGPLTYTVLKAVYTEEG